MLDGENRRRVLRALGAAATLGVAGCSGGGNGTDTDAEADDDESTATSATPDSGPFPEGSCLAAMTEDVPTPLYGFEFADGASPEAGTASASTDGAVSVTDGAVTFGEGGGSIRLSDVAAVNDLTVSLFANPAVAASDQWNVMLHYTPADDEWTGWGVEHGNGAVDFWAEGPGQGGTEVLTMSDSPLPTDTWSHVLGVKRGRDMLLYVDGQRVASSTFDYDISYGGAETVDLFLGRHGGGGVGDRHYRGALDSVAVWDGALSESEVQSVLSAGANCR